MSKTQGETFTVISGVYITTNANSKSFMWKKTIFFFFLFYFLDYKELNFIEANLHLAGEK